MYHLRLSLVEIMTKHEQCIDLKLLTLYLLKTDKLKYENKTGI